MGEVKARKSWWWARLVCRRVFVLDLFLVCVIGLIVWRSLPDWGPRDAGWFLRRGVEAAGNINDGESRTSTYIELASLQFKAGDDVGGRQTLLVGTLRAVSNPDASRRNELLSDCISAWAYSSDIATARLIADRTNPLEYEYIGFALLDAGKINEALTMADLFKPVQNTYDKERLYEDIGEKFIEKGDIQGSMRVASKMMYPNVAQRAILQFYMKRGNRAAIADLAAHDSETDPSRWTPFKLVDFVRRPGNDLAYKVPSPIFSIADDIVDTLRSAAEIEISSSHSIEALRELRVAENVNTYCSAYCKWSNYMEIAKLQLQSGDHQAALANLKKTDETRDSRRPLAELHAVAGDFAVAKQMAAGILENSRWWNGPAGQETEQGEAFRVICQAQADAGDWSGACITAATMTERKSQVLAIAYLGLIIHDPRLSRFAFGVATDLSLLLSDNTMKSYAFGYIAGAQQKRGDSPAARHTLEIAARACEPNTQLVDAFLQLGDFEGACAMSRRVADSSLRFDADIAIAIVLTKAGEIDRARAQFSDAQAMLMKIASDEDPDERFCGDRFTRVSKEIAKAGDPDALAEWIGRISDPNYREEAYIGAAEGLIERDKK